MGIFDWFRNRSGFRQFDDSFALHHSAALDHIKEIVLGNGSTGKNLWLIAHFPIAFVELQNHLESWQVNYEVVTEPIDANGMSDVFKDPTSIKLVLSPLIPTVEYPLEPSDSPVTQGLLIVDRHPLITHDKRILQFARNCPYKVELGYVLSLDHPVLKLVVTDSLVELMGQLGMRKDELISSSMVSRRLEKKLTRLSALFTGDGPEESAESWLEKYHQTDG
ncbi:MAG: hypothetical protein AAF939_15030 [Planctomycetota bacterium]